MEKDRRATWSSRRASWQYPPAPTPRILNLPRRCYRKKRSQVYHLPKQDLPDSPKIKRGKLGVLFLRDRPFAADCHPLVTVIGEPRRRRVDEQERVVLGNHCSFQTEMLREECRRLRATLEKMEKQGIFVQKAIDSAIRILVLGLEDDGGMVEALRYRILKLEKLKRIVAKGTETGRVSVSKESLLEKMKAKSGKCGGCCSAMANRVMDRVKAESEQWSQMQNMVEDVKTQISKLRRARDYWEYRTRESNSQLKSIRSSAQAWKSTALENEIKVKQLQIEVKRLREDKAATFEAKQRLPLGDISNTNYPLRESLYQHRPLQ